MWNSAEEAAGARHRATGAPSREQRVLSDLPGVRVVGVESAAGEVYVRDPTQR